MSETTPNAAGPIVPATLEGWHLLHLMFRIRWDTLRDLDREARAALAAEAGAALAPPPPGEGATVTARMLGHKAGLLVLFARRDFEGLAHAQTNWARTGLAHHLEPTTSFVSVVELGMYEMTAKIHRELTARGLEVGSEAYDHAFAAAMAEQRGRVVSRLEVAFPRRRHVCFYPMNKRRGEVKNWYAAPFEQRAAMMLEHGRIGRRFAGEVTQVISGAIGLDDWEWGVDLFADDPVVFKKLIYEMRFDEASAEYGEFGPFYVGLQFDPARLASLLDGAVPEL